MINIEKKECRSKKDFTKHSRYGHKGRNLKRLSSVSIKNTMLNNLLPKLPSVNTNPDVKGFLNKNTTIILFTDKKHVLAYASKKCHMENLTIKIDKNEIHLDDVYPEFKQLKEHAKLETPSYYLFKDYLHPMIAVYARQTGDTFYIVAPRILKEDLPKIKNT
jgi:hypothetical protein